ncbi:MAG: hypothetical protein ACFE9Z_10870 [Promethearchaeota archaeon]
MKFYSKILIIFIVFVLIHQNFGKIYISVANPVVAPIYRYSGGLLPQENVSLSLLTANVKIETDTSDLKYLGGISFQGNYTIFNPKNDLNLTIAAPFSINPENNLNVLVNDTSIPSDILYFNEVESQLWEDYIGNISWGNLLPRYWILCNISIPKNEILEIKYEFITPKPTYSNDYVSYDIIYDVGTARLWNGTITEKVDIRTHGHSPNSIYNIQLCNISDIFDGKSYTWEWIDERIEINFVGLHYYYDGRYEYNSFYSYIKTCLLSSISLVSLVVIIANFYKRRKNIRMN